MNNTKKYLFRIAVILICTFNSLAAETHAGERFEEDVVIERDIIDAREYEDAVFLGNLTIRNSVIRKEGLKNSVVVGNLTVEGCIIATNAFKDMSVVGENSIDTASSYFKDSYADAPTANQKFSDDVVLVDSVIEPDVHIGAAYLQNLTIENSIIRKNAFKGAIILGDLTIRGCAVAELAFDWINVMGQTITDETTIDFNDTPKGNKSGSSFVDDVIITDDVIADDAYKNAVFMGDLTVKSVIVGKNAFSGATILGKFILDEGVTWIQNSAFRELICPGQELELPSSLKFIDDNAFMKCLFIGKFEIPKKVSTIGAGAFHENYFSEIKLNAATKYYSRGETQQNEFIYDSVDLTVSADNVYGAFSKSNKLASIDIPADMKEIPAWIFKDSPQLKTINFPNPCALSVVGKGAFWGCTGLAELQLPQKEESIIIRDYAFWIPDIKVRKRTVYVPQGLEPYGDYYTAMDDIYLWIDPDNVEATPVIYSHWYDYGESYVTFTHNWLSSFLDFTDYAPDYVYIEAGAYQHGWSGKYNLGKLYIPKGTKRRLRSFLQSKIVDLHADTSKETVPIPYQAYPLLLYIPYENWIGIDMPEYPNCQIAKLGDLNGDKDVDSSDVSILLELVLNGSEIADDLKARADLNGDGDVDSSDISILLEIVLGHN